jgi:MarR family transcriptional regulator, organic hydroperoxide resistance regulator
LDITIPEEEHLCTRIRRAEQALITHHESVLRRQGLTMTQYMVLLTLSREGGMSTAQLARASGVTQQSMASVISGLQTKRLISREASPVHARIQIANLTPAGKDLLHVAYLEVAALEQAFGDGLTRQERTSLANLLDRATTILVSQTPTNRP